MGAGLLRKTRRAPEWEAWPCTPALTQSSLPHERRQGPPGEEKDCVLGCVRGHPAFRARRLPGGFTEASSPFICCARLGKVLNVLCRHKHPFCVTPAPAGGSSQPTISGTFISARTFQKGTRALLYKKNLSLPPTHTPSPRSEAQRLAPWVVFLVS